MSIFTVSAITESSPSLVAKTEAAQGLAALAASGLVGGTRSSNSKAWISIAEFLDAQHLATFGLKRVARGDRAERSDSRGTTRAAHPVGNTGTTSQPAPLPLGAAMPLSLGFNHG